MIYAAIDVDLQHHDKAILAGQAMYLWTFCMLWSRSQKGNGHVPMHVIKACPWSSPRQNLVAFGKLLDAGLFLAEDGGGRLWNYETKNDTREIIEKRIESNKVRQTRYKRKSNALLTRESHVSLGAGAGVVSLSVSSEPVSEEICQSPREAFVEAARESGVWARPRDPLGATFLAQAYADGQVSGGATAYPSPTSPKDIQALDASLAHARGPNAEPLRGSGLVGWVRTESEAYRRAKALSAAFERGYGPVKFLEWLNAGKPVDVAKDRYGKPVDASPPEVEAHTMSGGRRRRDEDAFHRRFAEELAAETARRAANE